jgi:dolichol-phosphate mannosyltransferase
VTALRWTETVLAPRQHDHVLVIPVLDEGERIRAQLGRIVALGAAVDVVVADGGSTDGSTDTGFLAANGVRALLVKTSGGRLSAQLRMAYRWALDEGYAGIVTMDGNGKDGVEAIPRFVAALEDGWDYVQGSRYRAGGSAINTPFDRWFAGRFVHAPLLSFGARRWLTDTTNGFRAYSSRYLADPRTATFRDVFSDYSLLFYLTVRASALGYRVTEIPVTRAYPAGGPVPTKIGGLGRKLALLGECVKAAAGRYDPPAGGEAGG